MIRLGVLDQAPVPNGSSPQQAVSNTIDLAVRAEKFGYSRYWVAEHHGYAGFASSAPEVLVGAIASHTNRIRVGAGGVLLNHYNPLKVAEVFRLLEALHPNRIELGLGQAPGGNPTVVATLSPQLATNTKDRYPNRLRELVHFLNDRGTDNNPPLASPLVEGIPPIWLLASSNESALLAAELGVRLAWAHFLSVEDGPQAVDLYRSNFSPSGQLSEPTVTVAASVVCGPTEEEANLLATSFQKFKSPGYSGRVPSPTEALAMGASLEGPHEVRPGLPPMVVGPPTAVGTALRQLATDYRTDDLTILTVCHDHEKRSQSYELTAQILGVEALPPLTEPLI